MKNQILEVNDNVIVCSQPKLKIYFFRPVVGIEEEMNDARLLQRIRSKFYRWRQ